MVNTANNFIHFMTSPKEDGNQNTEGMNNIGSIASMFSDKFQDTTADGQAISIFRFSFCENVSVYYAAVNPGLKQKEGSFQSIPTCDSCHFLAVQRGREVMFIQGSNLETLFGRDGARTLLQYSGQPELNFYDMLYYAQGAIKSRNKSMFKKRLPAAERGFPLHALDADVWRIIFDPDFETHLNDRFVSVLNSLQNPELDCWGNVQNPLSEELPYWDRWMVSRVLAIMFEPDFLQYNLSQDKDEYVATLKRKASSIKTLMDHPVLQYIEIPAILKKRPEVTMDFIDQSGKWRSVLVTNQAFSTMAEGELEGQKTMLMPIQNVAVDTEKIHEISIHLFEGSNQMFPGVKYWVPWCRIIDIRDGNKILWMNKEEPVSNDLLDSISF